MATPRKPVAFCHNVGALRAALAGYPDETSLVDDDGQPVAVVGEPGEAATDRDPALDPYIYISTALELALHQRVEPGDLHRAHVGAPASQGHLPLPRPAGPPLWWEAA